MSLARFFVRRSFESIRRSGVAAGKRDQRFIVEAAKSRVNRRVDGFWRSGLASGMPSNGSQLSRPELISIAVGMI